jgi:hypothetical protein
MATLSQPAPAAAFAPRPLRPELRAVLRCLRRGNAPEPDYAAADPRLVGVLAELDALRKGG